MPAERRHGRAARRRQLQQARPAQLPSYAPLPCPRRSHVQPSGSMRANIVAVSSQPCAAFLPLSTFSIAARDSASMPSSCVSSTNWGVSSGLSPPGAAMEGSPTAAATCAWVAGGREVGAVPTCTALPHPGRPGVRSGQQQQQSRQCGCPKGGPMAAVVCDRRGRSACNRGRRRGADAPIPHRAAHLLRTARRLPAAVLRTTAAASPRPLQGVGLASWVGPWGEAGWRRSARSASPSTVMGVPSAASRRPGRALAHQPRASPPGFLPLQEERGMSA